MCHHTKSIKETLDKSEQERSYQEPGFVGKRISNDGGVDSALHPFGRPRHREQLMCCDRILKQ
jgi:hypothetical protein